MKRFIAGLIVGAWLASALIAVAQETPAPVQIEWQNGDGTTWFDCYPAEPSGKQTLTVYVQYRAGLAIYACVLGDRFAFPPTHDVRVKEDR